MSTFLDKIVDSVKDDLVTRKTKVPLTVLRTIVKEAPSPRDFAAALRKEAYIHLIAEIKKASPSKGVLNSKLNPVELAKLYEESGASAISILTEPKFFLGSINDLVEVRGIVNIPVLRKDFIFEDYQIYEARAAGADALLLITALFETTKLRDLYQLTRSLGMHALVEVHNESELAQTLEIQAECIGINNRDLRTFNVDLFTTERLKKLMPDGHLVVSESGITTTTDVKALHRWGVKAMLVGESLVTAPNPREQIAKLIGG